MVLKPNKKLVKFPAVRKEEPEVQKTPKKKSKLPKDGYTPLLPPKRFLVREFESLKDPDRIVKHYAEISVKRFDGDVENAPSVYIQMYQESDFYTGYLKGRCVSVPLSEVYTLIEELENLAEECENHKWSHE